MNTQTSLEFNLESDTQAASATEALTIKSANLLTIRLVLNTADTTELLECLAQTIQETSGYFDDEPVLIDASKIEANIDWDALLQAMQQYKLIPAGFDAVGENINTAIAAGLVQFDLSMHGVTKKSDIRQQTKTEPKSDTVPTDTKQGIQQTEKTNTGPADAFVSKTATKVIDRPLRSGQRIYASGSDLIIIGMVSQGAEVIADGNIHVYGPLRGKAMAGAAGDTQAKIFTTQLEPELLAIAGVFKVFESPKDNPTHNQSAVVQLNNQTLEIKALE